MNETLNDRPQWQRARRILICLAVVVTVLAIFYTEEDWRGKRAWENLKRELAARGLNVDWNACIPAPVPDESNIFKAPRMTEWFVKGADKNTEFYDLLKSTNSLPTPMAELTPLKASRFLAWNARAEPTLAMIREALKRPNARIDGDYQRPWVMPVANFVALRVLAQTLAQRARCDLVLQQPQLALDELAQLHDINRMLKTKPAVLVEGMIDVAITGLYLNIVTDGLQSGEWNEPQLAELQETIKTINLPLVFADAFQTERVRATHMLETMTAKELGMLESQAIPNPFWWNKLRNPIFWLAHVEPRGWMYQNMVFIAELEVEVGDSFDLTNQTIVPHSPLLMNGEVEKRFSHPWPFKTLAALSVPNFTKAAEMVARNQTFANEMQIVCALERYRLANGGYPQTLEALTPQFMEKIPNDLIGGQPLKYQKTSDRKFLLYSIGWNEKDDGGEVAHVKTGDVWAQGDWVWPMANYP